MKKAPLAIVGAALALACVPWLGLPAFYDSLSRNCSTARPYSSAVQYGLACECTVPLGRPVEPDE